MMVANAWKEMRDAVPTEPGWVARRLVPESSVDLMAAVRRPDAVPSLLLELDTGSFGVQRELPAGRGFRVYPEVLVPGPGGRVRLCLVLEAEQYADVFSALAEDVADRVSRAANDKDAFGRFVGRLRTWQAFLERYGSGGIGIEAQTGLFGEITVLRRLLDSSVPADAAADAWIGPTGGVQDFRFGTAALEVKTTVAEPALSFEVPSLAQLDETPLQMLYVAHVAAPIVTEGGANLPELIADVRTRVGAISAAALDEIGSRLLDAGYLDTQADRYRERRYRTPSVRVFQVRDAFPRVRPADVRPGVMECSYSIELAACERFEMSWDEAIRALAGGSR